MEDWDFIHEATAPQAAHATAALAEPRACRRPSRAGLIRNAKKTAAAEKILTRLPAPGESVHLIHVGTCDGIHLLAAALRLTGPLADLWIATLGLNENTTQTLCEWLDAGTVARAGLVLSHYFRHVDSALYGRIQAALQARGSDCRAARTHAKVWVLRTLAGPAYVFEGSGNLRSCKAAEQLTIFHDPALADFHAGWIRDIMKTAAAQDRADEKAQAENAEAPPQKARRRRPT